MSKQERTAHREKYFMLECHLGLSQDLSNYHSPEPSQQCQALFQQAIPQMIALFDELAGSDCPICELQQASTWLVGAVEEDLDPDDWRDRHTEAAARSWLSASPGHASYVRVQATTNLDSGEWIDCVFAVSGPIKRSTLMMIESRLETIFAGREAPRPVAQRDQNFPIHRAL